MTTQVKITPNWMSSVDSPTYKLTLYLVHPSVWNNPNTLASLEVPRDSTGQPLAVVIAESGATSTYALDNLSIISYVTPGSSSGNTTSGVFQFNLYEILGFKLLNRVLQYSKPFNFITLQSAKYVLKVEFQGVATDTKENTKYGGQFFYSLIFKQIQSSISESGTQHNIIAHNSPKTAIALSKVKTDIVVEGASTVKQYLKILEAKLNESEIEYRKSPENKDPVSKHTWKITLGPNATTSVGKSVPSNGPGPNSYGKASVTESFDLGSKPIAGTSNAETAGGQNRNTENKDTIDGHINSETNLISYLRRFLTANVPALGELNKLERTDGVKRTVISVTPKITFGDGTDEFTDTSEMEIELVVDLDITYSIPQNDPQKQKEKQNNRGFQRTLFAGLPITKKYSYLYNGTNTEILSFDLMIDNAFFMAKDPANGLAYPEIKQTHVPTNPTPITVPKTASGAYATSLSQVDGSHQGFMERVAYAYAVASPDSLQVNESKGPGAIDTIDALADLEFRSRNTDYIQVKFKIKGDPFWMGTPGVYTNDAVVTSANYLNTDSLVLFLNHLPDENMTNPEASVRGEIDVAASGVYEVRKIETSMSLGKFDQQLVAYRNRNVSTVLLVNEMEVR
jgi:hypothetical protein